MFETHDYCKVDSAAVFVILGEHFYRGIPQLGATGFDMVSRIRGAGRGLLATLNRGTVKLIGKNNTQGQLALAA